MLAHELGNLKFMRLTSLLACCVASILASAGCENFRNASTSTPVAAPVTTAPLNWHPTLDQPIQQLQEVFAANDQQQPMNYTSSNIAFVMDAKLYLLFEQYIAALPEGKRAADIEEQRRWLQQRKVATSQVYDEYAGGTLASLVGNQAFIKATESRIATIEQRMKQTMLPAD